MARLSFRGGDDAATAATCVIARLQAWEDALAVTSRGNRPSS